MTKKTIGREVVMTTEDARRLILAGEAPENIRVDGDLWLRGCFGLTSLPDGETVGGNLYVSAPATFLASTNGLRCRSIRPIDEDRGYWSSLLDVDLDGCYDEIHEVFLEAKDELMAACDEEWQRVVIRGFFGAYREDGEVSP